MNFDYAAEKDGKLLIALIFSAAIHILLLCNWPVYRNLLMEKMRPGDIEVTYLKTREQPAGRQSEVAVKRSESQPEFSAPKKLISEEIPKAVPAKKSETEAPKRESFVSSPSKKAADQEQLSKIVVKQLAVPKTGATASVDASVDLQEIRLIPPSYSQVVRNRIIDNIDTRKTGGEGDVYVRFVVTSSGALKEVNIIDEKSTDDGVLRAAAFEAVKNSAPFPAFPEKVQLSEIAFTCQITFARR